MNTTTNKTTKTYSIRNTEGRQGRAWTRTYDSLDEASEALRAAMGWDEVVLSDGTEGTDRCGEQWVYVAYATQEECDTDVGQRVSQPTIVEA